MEIEALLDLICSAHGIARAKEYGQCGLAIDYNPTYGGYTLEIMTKDGCTVGSSPARMRAGNFYTGLRIAQCILEAKERLNGER